MTKKVALIIGMMRRSFLRNGSIPTFQTHPYTCIHIHKLLLSSLYLEAFNPLLRQILTTISKDYQEFEAHKADLL